MGASQRIPATIRLRWLMPEGPPTYFNPNLNQFGPAKTSTRFLSTTLPIFLWQ